MHFVLEMCSSPNPKNGNGIEYVHNIACSPVQGWKNIALSTTIIQEDDSRNMSTLCAECLFLWDSIP